MQIADKYSPQEIESKWYDYWIEKRLFHSEPDQREPYTIVIPPPNVTGMLHMGHMLNNTLQDVLVRRARMSGKNACWVPGMDHASIATEAKVVAMLHEKGIEKSSLSREKFLEYAWEWKEKYGGMILKQLRKLGASCDWDRTCFTMDEARTESVLRVFCDLYEKGKIYRGVRMVNWDPAAQTALSDEEVVFKESHGKLYYLRYKVEGTNRAIIVATTRPETILGDTALCVNPNDERYKALPADARVIVPLVGRSIPVIRDEYVDIEFGTGALKVTPAHDVNDYMLGEKYGLETIDIFNDDGTISEAAGLYVGLDRMDVRKQISRDLNEAGLMEKIEDYTNKVGFSERTNVAIEPKLSTQWFLSMQHFADIALAPVMDDEIEFYPKKYKNTYRHWLENIKDWCISRQLWWGHRIPAWYYRPQGEAAAEGPKVGEVFVDEDLKGVMAQAKAKYPQAQLQEADFQQDDDALDTWFSSWLWPISLFDGINKPDNEEINYYFPTSDLVTGPDIIFFWVARMIMAGYEYRNDKPFKHVYFTGIVRDKLGRKMSKSLGNSPDPIELIEKYGADGVRMGMMLSAPAGNDILFDETLCEQGRNFNNKIWNAFRLVKGWEVSADAEQDEASRIATRWFESKLREAYAEMDAHFAQYRISDALMTVYRLFWDEFSSWYLEMVKPAYKDGKAQPVAQATYDATLRFFDALLRMLHPFMPFITEELWQHLADRKEGESIMVECQTVEKPTEADARLCEEFEAVKQVVAGVRSVRNQKNIAPRQQLVLQAVGTNEVAAYDAAILKMANLEKIEVVEAKAADASGFMVGKSEWAVPVGSLIDVEAELEKAKKELAHLEGFLTGVTKKLSNENFVAHAPAAVVEKERKKQADAMEKIAMVKAMIKALK